MAETAAASQCRAMLGRHRRQLLLPALVALATVSSLCVTAEEDVAANKVSYDGAQLFRVRVNKNTRKLLDKLEESGAAEKWRGNATEQDLMVRSEKIDEVTEFLKSNNMTFKIIIDDIQRAIRSENPDEEEDRNKPYRLTWQRYHRLSDHMQFHDYLQKEFPNMVEVVNIGSSVEGRQMRVLKISSGQPNAKAVWIDGGTHAREWISPASVSYIISEFVENRAAHGPYVSGVDFYVAPFINPDGYEYSHSVDRLWRKNRSGSNGGSCSGTDLNRNYGYKWGGAGSSRQPCKEIYAGNRAFSEPETNAISRFVLANKDKIKAYVTFHSYGQYILYPWGYDRKVPPDYADLDRVGRKMARAIQSAGGPSYTVGNSAATLYAASGGADDWAKGAAGIKYTYTIELRDNGVYGFVLPAQFIEPTARDAMAAIKVIAEEVYNLP